MSFCDGGDVGSPGPAQNSSRKKPQTIDLCGEKLENVLRLQPAATETWRKIHNLGYFLFERIMVWGAQDMLLNICPITV